MRAARWASVLFLGSLATLAGLRFLSLEPPGSRDPSRPDRGTLAPVIAPAPERNPVARIDPSLGTVVDVASRGNAVVVLASGGWALHTPDASVTWRGSDVPGSPEWLDRPLSVALGDERLFVLDERRVAVSVWDRKGERLGELPLPAGSTFTQRPLQLALGFLGEPLVSVQRVGRDGAATWDLLRYEGGEGFRQILSIPGRSRTQVFEAPLLVPADPFLLAVAPLTHGVSRVDPETGSLSPLGTRTDPPLWRIPRHHRREYRRMLQGLPAEAAGLAELPPFWPSVRDATRRADGSLLLAVTAGEDRQHLEILAPDLTPLGRFNLDGYVEPVFLSHGRAFLVEEGMAETALYELVPPW